MTDSTPEFEPPPTRIVLYPDPVLTSPASPVTAFDGELHALVERMIELMREAEGVGLAAPQVGVSRRIFIAEPEPGPESVPVVFINPELELGGVLEPFEEGCLSIPEVRVMVRRPNVVKIRCRHRRTTVRSLQATLLQLSRSIRARRRCRFQIPQESTRTTRQATHYCRR